MIDTVIINQPAGAGDIIFVQSIAQSFIDQDVSVVWPVEKVYAPLAKHFPSLQMVDRAEVNIDYESREDYVRDGTRVIPLRFSDELCKVPYIDCMKSKYLYFGKDWTKWKDGCRILRDLDAEKRLYYEVLGLNDDDKYNLISEQCWIGGRSTSKIEVDNGLKNIYMTVRPDFTLIDWLMVMQNATTIHAISSASIYLFELFPMRAHQDNNIHLYVRYIPGGFPREINHDNYKYLLAPTGYTLVPLKLQVTKRTRT